MFQTYGVGDFPQTVMVGDMVFKLPARLKGYGVYNKMVMDIICIKMCGNNISPLKSWMTRKFSSLDETGYCRLSNCNFIIFGISRKPAFSYNFLPGSEVSKYIFVIFL